MIWIIGGTKDSRDILEKILEINKGSIIISTATAYGGKILEGATWNNKDGNNIRILPERLNEAQMESLIRENGIEIVIDASHPYAQNVSKSVISVTKRMSVKYIRFERKMMDYGIEKIKKFETLEDLKEFVRTLEGKNILSTLGSNNISDIKEMGEKNNLYIRILPTVESIRKAEETGYLPSKIIALQGPVDKRLNKAMLESYEIDYLITKESGATGGEKEKIDACRETGATVLVLKRPHIDYGIVYNDIEELINNI